MSQPAIQPVRVLRKAALDPAVTAELTALHLRVEGLQNALAAALATQDELVSRLREAERRLAALLPYLWPEEGSLPSDLEEKGPEPL